MRTTYRLLALACASTATLALAANALATPKLIVSGGPTPGVAAVTNVQVTEDKTDPAPLKITIYQPAGYVSTLTQAAGAQIGTVHADLQALAISPDAIIQADGTVLTDTPSKYVSNTCAPGTHTAVWLLHVTVSGQTIDVPVYIDPTTGSEAALGATKLVLCLSDPYDTAPASIRAPFGVKLINAKMTLDSGVITNPSSAGTFLWRSTITPWNPASPAPDAAKTVEAQSIVNLPHTLSLKATVKTVRHKHGKKKTTVTNSVLLSGTLLENLQGVQGASVTILAGGKKIGSTTTSASGAFSRSAGLNKKTTFQAKVTVAQRDVACVSPLPTSSVPGGCVGATIGGYTLSSAVVTATPKKK
jgi:hypothetical protein